MDTDSLYLALSVHDLYDGIRPAIKKEWYSLESGDCADGFSANSTTVFFHRTCCAKHNKHDRREPGLFNENVLCKEMICLCSKTYCCDDSQSNELKISSKRLNTRTLEDCGDGSMSNYCKVLEKVVNVTSTNRDSRTIQHAFATYEPYLNTLPNFGLSDYIAYLDTMPNYTLS